MSRPLGVTLLAAFFAVGASMCTLTVAMLAAPSAPIAALWVLKPQARTAFLAIGAWAFVLMLAVGTACMVAAVGLWRGRPWGRTIALVVLSVNLIGDLVNGLLRHEPSTLIGVPIAALFIWYLLAEPARRYCWQPVDNSH